MKFKKLTAVVCILFTSNCSAGLILDGTLGYKLKSNSMWDIQSDVDDGTVTPVAVADLPANGSADFDGHFAIYDGATSDRELLFGDVAMNFDFTASSNQLTGKLSKIMLIDDEGQKLYGQPVSKIQEKFTGSVALSGTADTDSIPLTASGNLVDESGTTHAMTLLADPKFYQAASGDFVLSSSWATGTLTENGGTTRVFNSGYMGATQSP